METGDSGGSPETVEVVREEGRVLNVQRNMSTKQVAAALNVTESTVQLYSRESRIPFSKTPGGHRRYDLDEVLGALAEETAALAPPLRGNGLGAGAPVVRSRMHAMDTARRAVVGEHLEPATQDKAAEPAVLTLIDHSRRVLVAV